MPGLTELDSFLKKALEKTWYRSEAKPQRKEDF